MKKYLPLLFESDELRSFLISTQFFFFQTTIIISKYLVLWYDQFYIDNLRTNVARSLHLRTRNFAECRYLILINGPKTKTGLALFSNFFFGSVQNMLIAKIPRWRATKWFVPDIGFKTVLLFAKPMVSYLAILLHSENNFPDATNATSTDCNDGSVLPNASWSSCRIQVE